MVVLREKLLVFALSEGLTAGYLTVVVSAVVSNKIDLADSQYYGSKASRTKGFSATQRKGTLRLAVSGHHPLLSCR